MTLAEWKQVAWKLHDCVSHCFNTKENLVILDFISTATWQGEENAEKLCAAGKKAKRARRSGQASAPKTSASKS